MLLLLLALSRRRLPDRLRACSLVHHRTCPSTAYLLRIHAVHAMGATWSRLVTMIPSQVRDSCAGCISLTSAARLPLPPAPRTAPQPASAPPAAAAPRCREGWQQAPRPQPGAHQVLAQRGRAAQRACCTAARPGWRHPAAAAAAAQGRSAQP